MVGAGYAQQTLVNAVTQDIFPLVGEKINPGGPGQESVNPEKEQWALVPVKKLTDANQRLAPFLGAEREGLSLAMLTDVLDALCLCELIDRVMVVTADDQVASIARQRGISVTAEPPGAEMNAAIDHGVWAIKRLRGRRVMIVPADIPLLSAAEIDRLIGDFNRQAINYRTAIGIAPAADRGGTNCLLIDTHQTFLFQYGPKSFDLHCSVARVFSHNVVILDSDTASMDIDEPCDILDLLEFCHQHPEFQRTRTWNFLEQSSLGRTADQPRTQQL